MVVCVPCKISDINDIISMISMEKVVFYWQGIVSKLFGSEVVGIKYF